ncbi:type II toxin-antitoxin system VapC family toxin [Prosthecobacter vanneervenii]|uniref:Putative nucleic acid-binding protein n=1 Tax=Prosthecobacter vanneervenii TaxID=48466 RepID=A0A7W7YGD4_9BACT|nr:PIN domain-containing protein [Prosthecobacter vanneervenii]MBB5035355.1 putative nucleic acid-binding protein [Prosthecobacter vanneervenii]
MICLDTNYLILGLMPGSRESQELIQWAQAGETLITAMPAWYEFTCGPVTAKQVAAIRSFLHHLIAFDEPLAAEAARLFNAAGRKRTLRIDAMIAATAIVAGASLATNNLKDFSAFVPHGLKLV